MFIHIQNVYIMVNDNREMHLGIIPHGFVTMIYLN